MGLTWLSPVVKLGVLAGMTSVILVTLLSQPRVFFTMASFRRQLLVYRKLPDANGVMRWTVIKSIDTPTALPYIWSPEAFVHNGRSYIFMQLSASSKAEYTSTPIVTINSLRPTMPATAST